MFGGRGLLVPPRLRGNAGGGGDKCESDATGPDPKPRTLPRFFHLPAACADGTHPRRFLGLASADVLASDDFGRWPVLPDMAEDLYEFIRERYERKAISLTSIRALAEWPDTFGKPLLASAALDRLTHTTPLPHPGHSRRKLPPGWQSKGGLPRPSAPPRSPSGGLYQAAHGWPTFSRLLTSIPMIRLRDVHTGSTTWEIGWVVARELTEIAGLDSLARDWIRSAELSASTDDVPAYLPPWPTAQTSKGVLV